MELMQTISSESQDAPSPGTSFCSTLGQDKDIASCQHLGVKCPQYTCDIRLMGLIAKTMGHVWQVYG